MNVAFVFPGQGSQEVGMGRAMAEAWPEARAAFDEADKALAGELNVSQLCFDGPLEDLTLTANTQPAVLATSIACLRALRAKLPTVRPRMLAGHSLGEYTALVASGALDFGETVRLVRLRGQAMQEAVPPGTGAMAAVIGVDSDVVAALCEEVERSMPGRTVAPANFNGPGQIVVAGHADAVKRVGELAAERKARAMPLKVSAPFHSALMKPAAERLAAALEPLHVGALEVPVVANVNAEPNLVAERVKSLLVTQVAGAVRWEQCVNAMWQAGVDTFVEIGPGKVLANTIKRIQKGARLLSVSDPVTLDAAASVLASGSAG